MRVVYVCSLDAGGPVAHLQSLAPAVAETGADVKVVCSDERVAAGFKSAGLEAVVVPMRHKLDLAAGARVWPHVEGADVVHTHDRRAGLLARPVGRARGATVFHTYHGLPEEIAVQLGRANAPTPPGVSRVRLAWLLHGYLRIEAVLASFSTIVVPSRAMAAFLLEHGIGSGNVRVLRHGIEPTRTETRARNEPFRVATAAKLEYWKGIDVLIAACARVSSPIALDVFGDGSERPALEHQASALGVDARFHGWVEGARDRLETADAFVLPSRAENAPISILEAMAAAVPVVGTRVGGVPELIEDGTSGLIVEPDDPAELAGAIERLAADEPFRLTLGREAARRVATHFAAADFGRRAVELYRELPSRSDRPDACESST